MISRRITPKRQGRRYLTALAAAGLLGGMLLSSGAVLAVHDEGVFGLEGNAITGGTPCTDAAQTTPAGCEPANPVSLGFTNTDWDKVYNGTSGAEATSFLTDTTKSGGLAGQGDTILSQDTKDIQDVSQWTWKQTTTTSVQDKDDIEHAYAAQFNLENHHCGSLGTVANCTLLYFGADRFSNSGDAVMGFWLLQDRVETVGPDANGNGTFTGNHTARGDNGAGSHGDILIVSDFRSGGKAPQIQIYEWVNSAGSASTHLDQIAGGPSPASCTQAPPEGGKDKNPVPPVSTDDNYCATANQFLVHSPWKFSPKANSGGTAGNGTLGTPVGTNPDANTKFGVAEFMEGGINMTALGLGNECFNTFYAESRASHSVTSTLSDFVLGGFGSCGASLATQTSKTTLEIGEAAPTDTATVTVTSTGGNPPAPTGDVSFYLCGPSTTQITSCDPTGLTAFDTETLGAGGPADYSVTSTAPTITSVGYYCFAARWPGDDTYADGNEADGTYGDDGTNECFSVTPVQPGITTDESTDATPVTPGTEIWDTATLTDTVAPSNGVDGTITWTAYGPEADATTCSTVAYTSTIDVTGNATYDSRDGDGGAFKPTDPGNYNWIAVYTPDSGDVNNLSATTACGDANEGAVVQQYNPALTTAQTWTVSDSATITVAGGGDLAGTATFELWDNANCDDSNGGTMLYTQDVPVAGASGTTVSTTVTLDTTFTASAPTLYWNVSYSSDNAAQTGIAASCTENSSLTINN